MTTKPMNFPKLMVSDFGDSGVLVVLFLERKKGIALHSPKSPYCTPLIFRDNYAMWFFKDFTDEIVLTNS